MGLIVQRKTNDPPQHTTLFIKDKYRYPILYHLSTYTIKAISQFEFSLEKGSDHYSTSVYHRIMRFIWKVELNINPYSKGVYNCVVCIYLNLYIGLKTHILFWNLDLGLEINTIRINFNANYLDDLLPCPSLMWLNDSPLGSCPTYRCTSSPPISLTDRA